MSAMADMRTMDMTTEDEPIFDNYMESKMKRFGIERSSYSGDYYVTEYGWRVAGPFWWPEEAQEWIQRQ